MDEVLPSLRKSGTYAVGQMTPTQILRLQLEAMERIELEQKQQNEVLCMQSKRLHDVAHKVDTMGELLTLNPEEWRGNSRKVVAKIAKKLGGFEQIQDEKKRQHFVTSIITAVAEDEKLAKCEPQSILSAGLKCLTFGFIPGGGTGDAYLIPYKDKCTFQLGYKGLIKLAQRSGVVKALNMDVLRKGETVVVDRLSGDVTITGEPESPDAEAVGYFAFIRLTNGFEKVEYMSKAQAVNHAAKYASSNFDPIMTVHYMSIFIDGDVRPLQPGGLDGVKPFLVYDRHRVVPGKERFMLVIVANHFALTAIRFSPLKRYLSLLSANIMTCATSSRHGCLWPRRAKGSMFDKPDDASYLNGSFILADAEMLKNFRDIQQENSSRLSERLTRGNGCSSLIVERLLPIGLGTPHAMMENAGRKFFAGGNDIKINNA